MLTKRWVPPSTLSQHEMQFVQDTLRSQGFCKTGQQFPSFQRFLQERWLHSNWLSLHLWGNGTLLQRSDDWACVIPRIVADDVNPSCIFSFQLRCLTRVRPPTEAVRILQFWFICKDASDSLFCPSVIRPSDRVTWEAVTAEKVALSVSTWTGIWSQSSSEFTVGARGNKTVSPIWL